MMERLSFIIRRGDVFVIMGGSGSGKSTLLRHLVGLQRPAAGTIHLGGANFWDAGPAEQQGLQRRIGVMYQQGALWTSMTLAENVTLPLGDLHRARRRGAGRDRRVQAGAGRARRLRRLLSVRDQRRHAQACRDRAGHGARPRDPVPRRAVGGARPDQLAAPGRPDPRAAGQPGHDDRDRDARAGEHLRHRATTRSSSTSRPGP